MKTTDPGVKLGKLLDRVTIADAGSRPPVWPEPVLDADQPVLNEFLRSFLIWDAGIPAARVAARRLADRIVDFNDLRVCLPDDLRSLLGADYPLADERAQRLRVALSDLTRRTHTVSLEHLGTMSKRDARAYLDSLEGVPPYVSARVVLLAFGVHAMPVDRRTHARLVEAGAVPEDWSTDDAADHIQRRFKAGELLGAHLGLQTWADEQPDADAGPRKTRAGHAGGST